MKRRVRGFTLLEMLVSLVITSLLMFSALAVLSATARGMSRSQATSMLAGNSRQGMELILYQIRAGEQVQSSASLYSTTFSSTGSTFVLRAPSYNSSLTSFIIDNTWDFIAVSYDSANKTVIQSVAKTTNSQRPTANRRIIAHDVTACSFRYQIRDNFNYTRPSSNVPSTVTFTLNASPATRPMCYVNGVSQTVTWSSGTSVTIPTPSTSTNVQFVYTLNNNGAALNSSTAALVTGIEVTMTVSTVDGNGVTRTRTLTGDARLRNSRK